MTEHDCVLLTFLYRAALTLAALMVFAILWRWGGPVVLLPLLPALWAIGYPLISGRDDPLTAWWERQRPRSRR